MSTLNRILAPSGVKDEIIITSLNFVMFSHVTNSFQLHFLSTGHKESQLKLTKQTFLTLSAIELLHYTISMNQEDRQQPPTTPPPASAD